MHVHFPQVTTRCIISNSATHALLMPPPRRLLHTRTQVDIIAAYGERLLEWLQRYTFPAESKFAASGHATACADFFVRELLRNGTTCALAFCTVHPGSVDALLERASDAGMMMICGKVMRRCKVNTTRGVW